MKTLKYQLFQTELVLISVFPIKVKIGGDNAKDTRGTSTQVSSPSSPPIKRYGQKTIQYLNQVVAMIMALPRCPDQFWSFYSEISTTYSNRTCEDTSRLPTLFFVFFWLPSIDFVLFCFLDRSYLFRKRKKKGRRPVCRLEHELRRV